MGADNKTKKRNKKRKATVATIQTKEGKAAGKDPRIGHEERLEAFIKRALELKHKDYIHSEIAHTIAKEFNLVVVPTIATVSNWLNSAFKATDEEIKQLQFQMRMAQFERLERLIAKWFQISTADELEIQRWKMVEGTLQPFMDENATAEQIAATNTLVKLMDRQAKLLGLDLSKAIDKDGTGPQTLQEAQMWILNQVTYNYAPNGAPIDGERQVLELKSGLEDQL